MARHWNSPRAGTGVAVAIASAALSVSEEITCELMIRSGVYKSSMYIEIRSWGSITVELVEWLLGVLKMWVIESSGTI